MDIVFNINNLGLEGLGATLTSLVRNCADTARLKLTFLCSDLKKNDKENITQLLQQENYLGGLNFLDFDARKTFGHLRSLHGDWTAYGRLLIPEKIQSESALYLDSDLIVNLDVLELLNFSSDKILSVVCGSSVKWSLESSFFIEKLKWSEDTNYFNSGVMLFNISKWKKDNIDKKVKQISKKYPDEFLSADQTLLNAVCEGNFSHLPQVFNLAWYPGNIQPENRETAILHFVGSPKPWDLFGKKIHKGYSTWTKYDTAFWKNRYGRLTAGKIRRTWKIRKSIFKHLKAILINK